jgi:oxygen-dependent protoporphyrinogen oxidase
VTTAARGAPPRIAVVGGGISGLSAAHYLLRAAGARGLAIDVTVFEAADRLGGKVATRSEDGWVMEGGPDAFLVAKPWALELCRELGLASELIPTSIEDRSVFVLSGGRLHRLPAGVRLLAPTRWRPFLASGLMSWPGKLRVALDLVLPRRASADPGDESIGAFVRRRLGRQALAKLAGPLMAGIYVGDPDRLSLRQTFPQIAALEDRHGSVIRGLRALAASGGGAGDPPEAGLAGSVFFSLRGGTGRLVEALAEAIGPERIAAGRAITAVEPAPGAPGPPYRLTFADGPSTLADGLVLAGPASTSAGLVAPWAPGRAADIRAIPHLSSAVLNLGYDASAFTRPLRGYGYVVASGEPHEVRACSWSSSKLAGRAPEGKVLLRAFFGGAGREDEVALPESELVARAEAAFRRVLGLRGHAERVHLARWPGGNPQYAPGHGERLRRIEEGCPDGLALLGAAFRGVGVPDCVRAARAAAEAMIGALGR